MDRTGRDITAEEFEKLPEFIRVRIGNGTGNLL